MLGIDLSTNSPAFAVLKNKSLTLFFYPHIKKQMNFRSSVKVGQNDVIQEIHCIALPGEPLHQVTNNDFWIKAMRIATDFALILDEMGPLTKIRMEGYAINAVSAKKDEIHELGGIVKFVMAQRKLKWEIIAPSCLKKIFTGKGNADKWDMFSHFVSVLRLPNLMDVLDVTCGTDIPKPVEDMVDASALVLTEGGISVSKKEKNRVKKEKEARKEERKEELKKARAEKNKGTKRKRTEL